ncbi:hypothetical protein ACFE04_015983 [Oxalis oulophora]
MDIHVMDNRDVLGTRVIGHDQEEEEEDSEPDNGNADDESSVPDDDGNPEPYVGMEFHSDDVAKTFYEDYARKLGFTAIIGHCSRLKPITRDLVCGKEGSKKKSAENCDALLRIQLMDNGKWVVTKFVKEHSHLLASNGTNVHYLNPQKRFAGAAEKTMPKSYQGVNIVPSGMMYVSVDGNRATSDTNVRGIKNMEPTRLAKNSGPANYVTSSIGYDDRKASTSALDNTTPLLWPRQDEMTKRFNLNDSDTADVNLPRMGPVSLHRDEGAPENAVVLPCLKTMTWAMENKNSTPGNRVAVINLKLQDYGKTPSAELEVKFQLSRVTLEPMLKSMAYISEQLSTPANRVAVINLKLQDAEATSGESQVKFQVSRDTLAAMLRSMAYIREQLSNGAETPSEPTSKKQRR